MFYDYLLKENSVKKTKKILSKGRLDHLLYLLFISIPVPVITLKREALGLFTGHLKKAQYNMFHLPLFLMIYQGQGMNFAVTIVIAKPYI